MANVTRVRVLWDAQDPSNEGWHASTFERDAAGNWREADDSQKIWFPVVVDDFGRDQAEELHEALVEAFPDAEIEMT